MGTYIDHKNIIWLNPSYGKEISLTHGITFVKENHVNKSHKL